MRSATHVMTAPAGWTRRTRHAESGLKARPANDASLESEADLAGLEDPALVRAFQTGRTAAFDVIVLRHQRAVYLLCHRFVHHHEDAADLAQDVFVRAFKGLRKFKGDASLATWLYRIGVNVCLNRVASKTPASAPLETADSADPHSTDPLRELVRSERSAELQAAIEKLPPKQKATLLLRVYQECSHEEIATALDSTVGAVRANFFHALGNLRRMLKTP